MICPCDQTGLTRFGSAKPHVYNCPVCSGIWLPGETLRRVFAGRGIRNSRLEALIEGQVSSAPPSNKRCPVCKQRQLSACRVTEVEVDFCPGCEGLWLDKGELIILKKWHAEHGSAAQSARAWHGADGTVDLIVWAPDLVGEALGALAELVIEALTSG